MSNHIHLLLQTPNSNIDSAMRDLFREVSKKIGKETGRINHIFGNRYKGCLIDRESYLYHVYKYVYRNPTDAKMVKSVEDYQFSTLQFFLNNKKLPFECGDLSIVPCDLIPETMNERLDWLNTPYKPKENDLIEKALRRKIFHFNRSTSTKAIVRRLETPKRYTVPFERLVDGFEG